MGTASATPRSRARRWPSTMPSSGPSLSTTPRRTTTRTSPRSFSRVVWPGGAANVACYPFDFARTRLASDLGSGKGQFNGIADCIQKTVQQGGVTGLYRGSAVTVAGAFVYRGGQLGLFAQVMDMNPYKQDKGIIGIVAAFVCATVARTITTPFNYPFDTVRRRMMLDSENPAAERLYRSGVHCFLQVSKTEGPKGVYKGLIPELFRGLGGPLVLTAYDRIKLIIGI